jgi:hypothetical protein
MSPTVIFVAGASRYVVLARYAQPTPVCQADPCQLLSSPLSGIGLETVRQLARDTDVRVVAAARNPAGCEDLQKIVAESKGRVETVTLDVVSEESIAVRPTPLQNQPVNRPDTIVLLPVLIRPLSRPRARFRSSRTTPRRSTSSCSSPASPRPARSRRSTTRPTTCARTSTSTTSVPSSRRSPSSPCSSRAPRRRRPRSCSSRPSLARRARWPTSPWVSVTAGYSASKAALNMFARKVAAELAADDSSSVPREGGWAVGLVSAHLPSMPLDLQLTIMTVSSSASSSSFSSSSDSPRCGSPPAVSRSVALLFP